VNLAQRLLLTAVDAVDAQRATRHALQSLMEGGERLQGCTLLAFGKASLGMAEAAVMLCEPRGGLLVALTPERWAPHGGPPLEIRRGGHPVPTEDAAETGQCALDMVSSLTADDALLCLVSGGGSAMLELPVPGVTVAQIRERTRTLMRRGADIHALNRERTRLSQLKGGKLARAAAPARVVNVILSDVPGGDLSVVASGPTVPPPGHRDEYGPVRSVLAADNDTAQDAIVDAGRREGLRLVRAPEYVRGEAREAGARFYAEARHRCTHEGLHGIVWGGETTVHVTGQGRGGRNQELVLGAAQAFAGGALGSLGTDGIDGESEAAGAWLDADVLARARRLGLTPHDHLERNDSEAFFRQAGGLMVTGPTGTNVADVCLYLHG
jgi:glycerate 2-kinase